jgi:predicted DNA-binding transcriptional regulator AlpA
MSPPKRSRPAPGEGSEPRDVPVGTDCASVDDNHPAVERLLLPDREAADLLWISTRTLHARVAAGLFPLPVRIGRCVRWRSDELRAWVVAGCPPRSAWKWESQT